MTHYLRYFIFTLSFFLSINAFAVDHIICRLSHSGIPPQAPAGQTYENVYTCSNTYPASFPAIQLSGAVLGYSAGTNVSGSCVTQKLASGANCLFKLSVRTQAVKQTFRLQVSVGSLYYTNLPEIAIIPPGTNLPVKVLAFHNNTNEIIYPVIEAPQIATDSWMQALFEVSNADIGTYRFQATKLHRVYVNGVAGILPHQTALVSVPFYSTLVATPSGGNVPDQYVDWWSSMRIYIYDVQSNLIQTQSEAGVLPVTLFSPGPTCISGCSQTRVFEATGIMPTNDPQQLLEYTFADVITSVPAPYPINPTVVNYDYSAVDQIYLPIALEPYGPSSIGYTGTVMNLTSFRNNLDAFLPSWPVYSGLPYPRVPGAYNVVMENPQLTPTGPQITALTDNWNDCVNDAGNPNHGNCLTVRALFIDNYQNGCGNAGLPSDLELIQHIYGYASFCFSAFLPSSGADFDAYTALQYNFLGYEQAFNPYTQLIHQTLKMNVYAYSVDDAVGFIRAIGNGLVIAVGGASGLPNPQQYNQLAVITVNPGTPPPGSDPVFTHFGICSPTASSGQLGRGASFSFQLPNSSFPCQITLEDSNKRLYHFTLNSPAPLTSTAADISCVAADNPWCSTVLVASSQIVNTAVPYL